MREATPGSLRLALDAGFAYSAECPAGHRAEPSPDGGVACAECGEALGHVARGEVQRCWRAGDNDARAVARVDSDGTYGVDQALAQTWG